LGNQQAIVNHYALSNSSSFIPSNNRRIYNSQYSDNSSINVLVGSRV